MKSIQTSILIIGTGFSGLGTAIRLKQEGTQDFLVLERAEDVGGTWRDNTYPGCGCDIESHLYSFSFAPNPRWSRAYSRQPEIWQYLRDCADRFGVRQHIRFRETVRSARWDDSAQEWVVESTSATYRAQVLISAMGGLSEPKLPEIPGIDTFRGKTMHSARWDHDYPLDSKRVAVIGTGASAVQFVPEIQSRVGRLHLFQRTPPWVVPKLDRAFSEGRKRGFERWPGIQRSLRKALFGYHEVLGAAFRHPVFMVVLQALAKLNLRWAVRDPELRRKLTPDYVIGCKRILQSNDYFPALTRENVEVVTDPITEIRERSVVTRDGQEREVDAIIFGTGFRVTELPFAEFIRGRDGRTLAEVWKGTPTAHLGTAVPGFPNLFLLLGPGTGLGHNSVVLLIESQIKHVLKALAHLRDRGLAAIEASPDSHDRYNLELQKKLRKTVWATGGCSSWYLDRNGVNSVIWPASVPEFRRRVEPFNESEYRTWPRA